MVRAIRMEATGGVEVLHWEEVTLDPPGEGEAQIRHTAIGVNFIDTYHRTGLYPVELPCVLGMEAAGVVEDVGQGVAHVETGDRVVYGAGPIGAYAEARNVPAQRLVRLPEEITDREAAAAFVKGLTVRYLVRQTHEVLAGETVLWHAAAGGVGLIACQWLRALGANVIGTVGTEEKGELAKEHGCDHVILYRHENITERVREITDGEMCRVAFDSVGASTFEPCLASLAPRGMMVTFGNASGPVDAIPPLALAKQGSVFLTRPRLVDYYKTLDETADGIAALFEMITSGAIKPYIGARYPVQDAAQAHRDLEARKTVGSSVLVV